MSPEQTRGLSFRLEAYKSESRVRTKYIAAIIGEHIRLLGKHNLSAPSGEDIYLLEQHDNSSLVYSFFMLGYSPDTKIGQLVQIMCCKDTLRARAAGKINCWYPRQYSKRPAPPGLHKTVDLIEKEIAADVFGPEWKTPLQKLRTIFFSHRAKHTGLGRKALNNRRTAALHELLKENT